MPPPAPPRALERLGSVASLFAEPFGGRLLSGWLGTAAPRAAAAAASNCSERAAAAAHAASEPVPAARLVEIVLVDTARSPPELSALAARALEAAAARSHARVSIVSADDAAMRLAARWALLATPCALVLDGGRECLRLVGFRSVVEAAHGWLPALLLKLQQQADGALATPAGAEPAAPAADDDGLAASVSGSESGAAPSAFAAAGLADRAPTCDEAAVPAVASSAGAPVGAGDASDARARTSADDADATTRAHAATAADETIEAATHAAAAAELASREEVEMSFDQLSIFRQRAGGMPARGAADERLGGDEAAEEADDDDGEVFVLGIVDILQQWDFSKRVESSIKALRRPLQAGSISAVDPKAFKARLLEYVARVVVVTPHGLRTLA
jgi:hypothetical protein